MTSSVEHQRLADDYWFQVPSTSLCATDVLRRAYDKNVVLESLFIRGLSAYGTIRVTNISFNKWVAVRFTTDEWRTTHSLNAHYLMHYDDTNTDSFQFKLTVPAEALPSSPRTLIFAILYRTEYDRFWDNNRSQDYRLKILRRADVDPIGTSRAATPLNSESVRRQIVWDYQANSAQSQHGQYPCGLRNLGGTCYMNSVLQALSFTSSLSEDLLLAEKTLDTNSTVNRLLVNELVNVLYLLHFEQSSSISPMPFKQILGDLKPMYRGNQQQDAHEFLTFLLDYLHDALDNVSKPSSGAHTKSHSPILDAFYGAYQSSTTCLRCSKEARTLEPFTCLTLPIPSTDRCTLDDCLKQLSADEYLMEDSRWHCPSCETLCDAKRNLTIHQLPTVLIIQLKRFEMSPDWGWIKNQAVVVYPEDSLELKCSSQARYSLYSVINHQGSLDDGHYTTFCRHSNRESSPWWFCDDEKIQYLDKERFHSNSNAYLLFYALQTNTVSTYL